MKTAVAAILSLVVFTTPVWAGVKEDQHQQMIDLAQQMRQLKAAGEGGSSAYAALAAQYGQISAAMGGDDPGKVIPDGQPAVDGRSPAPPEGGTEGVVPAAPPGCTPTTSTFSQNTPTAIVDLGVVTSTLAVAGAGPYLYDVNLVTNLTHSFPADLDITLQSPAGTVVTLTTDNGAGSDNVFNGTAWDDDANPAGQVPYSTNNGLVTDHAYVNLTLASPLVPEEAMAAFIGENPNGTWTITISDDAGADVGTLSSWTLELTTLPAAPLTAATGASNNTPVAIPTGPAVVSSTVVVAGAGTSLLDLNLTAAITHTFASDLDITLQSPAGTVVTLTTDNGAGNDNVFDGTIWNDSANPAGQVPYTTNNGLATDHAYVNLTPAVTLVVEEAMGAFVGENPNGTWTITISDDLAGEGGSLNSWTLNIVTASCACVITCPANISNVPNAAGQCGATVNYPAPTTNGACGVVTCAPPSGSFFPAEATTAVTCNTTAGPSCGFTIRVEDVQAPAITCPANLNLFATPTEGGRVGIYATPTPTDNCPGVAAASCAPPSGTFFPIGTTPLSCGTQDAAGNASSCSFNAIVTARSVTEIPTLDEIGLALLVLLLGAAALVLLRRQM